MMNFIAWNVKGLNKVYKQKELKKFCRTNKVVLIAIIEHRVKRSNVVSVLRKALNN